MACILSKYRFPRNWVYCSCIASAVRSVGIICIDCQSVQFIKSIEMDELFNQHVHFDSYDDFCSAFRVSEKKYSTNFVVASSQKLKIDGIFTADIVEKFKYRRIVYKCKYHGEPKANDARQRDTKTYKRGCQAYFAVSYKKCDFDRRFRLIITEFHIEHNHLLSKENFDSLPRQRNEKLQKHGAFVKQAAEMHSAYVLYIDIHLLYYTQIFIVCIDISFE